MRVTVDPAASPILRWEVIRTRSIDGSRDFDRRYAENEAAYHQSVNGVVANDFIPNVENVRVKAAFRGALEIFLVHQEHAEALDRKFGGT